MYVMYSNYLGIIILSAFLHGFLQSGAIEFLGKKFFLKLPETFRTFVIVIIPKID